MYIAMRWRNFVTLSTNSLTYVLLSKMESRFYSTAKGGSFNQLIA